jgi:hypothetical protein
MTQKGNVEEGDGEVEEEGEGEEGEEGERRLD